MFDSLFSPIDVGPIKIRNRIVSSANFSGLAENHLPSERLAYYHGEKARGGVGITIVEEMPVSSSTRFALPRSIFAYERRCIPGFKLLTSRVHEFGAVTFGQLIHRGAHAFGYDPDGYDIKLESAPSQIPSLVSPDGYSIPHEMSVRELEKEAHNYALTTTNLLEAGFDGAEIKCDSSSLPIQFLSPLTNKRNDDFGGTFDNRMKFLELVVSEVYGVTAGTRVLGIKMPGDEFVSGGLGQNDMQEVAKRLESSGKIDYVAVGGGNLGFDPDFNTPSAYYDQGLFVNLAQGIRDVISSKMKVIALGRITDPAFAESVITSGKADLVIMMRAMIADPELPKKAKEGRSAEIIPCIGCNQGCLGHVLSDRPTSCILNPATSREKLWGIGTVAKAGVAKHLVIVGAGPAGIECAITTAMRGHRVEIFEQTDSIGGQIKLASKLPGRKEFEKAITFWKAELHRLGVEVHLNHRLESTEIAAMKPDIVVCATGALERNHGFSPAFPAPEGSEFIRSVSEIVVSNYVGGSDVCIYDDRGDFQLFGWAELCAKKGAKVTVLTRNPTFGMFVDPWTRLTAHKRLYSLQVKFIPDVFLKTVTERSLTYYNIYSNEKFSCKSDITYFLSWPVSDSTLSSLLENDGVKVFSIGDCVSPRSIEEAVFEGYKLGRTV